jgi:pyruvate kinase
MVKAGMDVARVNFSHGSREEQRQKIKNIVQVRDELKSELRILGDLQGPKIRLGAFDNAPVEVEIGDKVTVTLREEGADEEMTFPLPHPEFVADIKPGENLLLDDGLLEFKVLDRNETDLFCEVVVGGPVKPRKGVSAPASDLKLSAIPEKDREDLKFLIDEFGDVFDFVAMSFVRSAADIQELLDLMKEYGKVLPVMAKVEKPQALENIDAIIDACEAGIMVARGDLGVEAPLQNVAIYQKRLIDKCNAAGKFVITATEMLASMEGKPRPTRAEVSDVTHAILDGTDATMLSGESAAGDYPVRAVAMMRRIIEATEESEYFENRPALKMPGSGA